MNGLVEQEVRSWTNVSGPDLAWLSGWSRPTTRTYITGGTDELLAYLREDFDLPVSCRRDGVYRVVLFRPESYSDVLLDNFELAENSVSVTDFAVPTPTNLYGPSEVDINLMMTEIKTWLDLTYTEIAAISGVSRSALFYWKKSGGPEPRPGGTRRILRLHSLASFLIDRLGVRGAQGWLNAGDPSPLERLFAEGLERVEAELRTVFFRQPELRESPARAIGREAQLELTKSPAISLKRSTRRAKRA